VTAKRDQENYRQRVYQIVRKIPRGRVMTYGQIAELLGEGYTPRTVGYCMHSSPDGTPWQRVVNAQGGYSTGRLVLPHDKQQRLLELEGIKFNKSHRCDLQTYLWIPELHAKPEKKVSLFKKGSKKRGAKR